MPVYPAAVDKQERSVELMEYEIWKTNRLSDNILTELVGKFGDLELAKDFVDYKAQEGDSYAVAYGGTVVYPCD